MTHAWTFPALRTGMAFIARLLAIGFRASTSLLKTVAGVIAPIIGAHLSIGGLQAGKQQSRFLSCTDIATHRNSKAGHGAIANWGHAVSFIIDEMSFLQPSA